MSVSGSKSLSTLADVEASLPQPEDGFGKNLNHLILRRHHLNWKSVRVVGLRVARSTSGLARSTS